MGRVRHHRHRTGSPARAALLIFLIMLLLSGGARADPSIELSGATGFGVLAAGVTSFASQRTADQLRKAHPMRMRLLFGSIAALLLVRIVLGCTWVDPDQCWPNTSGGFGGSGTIPIAAGVGATTSGDFPSAAPPRGPLASGGTPNPCVTPESSGGADKPQNPGSADPFTILDSLDPQEVALKLMATEYAAVAISSLVEAHISDPMTVDEATVKQLFDQYGPTAVDQTRNWMASVDPSTITKPPIFSTTCQEDPYYCPWREPCAFTDGPALCYITECAKGKCSFCGFDFAGVVFKHWCGYSCIRGNQYVGAAVMLRTIFGWDGPMCLPFNKPQPI
jgi:hypothetical protein